MKPHKDNRKRKKKVRFNERGSIASQKEYENGDANKYKYIYACMSQMSGNDRSYSRDFGDSSQLTNRILDSAAKCYMTPQYSYFIPGSLEDTDKYIEVVDGHYITAKTKRTS